MQNLSCISFKTCDVTGANFAFSSSVQFLATIAPKFSNNTITKSALSFPYMPSFTTLNLTLPNPSSVSTFSNFWGRTTLHQRELRQRARGLHALLHVPENRLEAKIFPERHHRGATRLKCAVDLLRALNGVWKEEDAKVGQDRVERVVRVGEGLTVLEAQILNLSRERWSHGDDGFKIFHHVRRDVGGGDLG